VGLDKGSEFVETKDAVSESWRQALELELKLGFCIVLRHERATYLSACVRRQEPGQGWACIERCRMFRGWKRLLFYLSSSIPKGVFVIPRRTIYIISHKAAPVVVLYASCILLRRQQRRRAVQLAVDEGQMQDE
jgi:hypothetical protein